MVRGWGDKRHRHSRKDRLERGGSRSTFHPRLHALHSVSHYSAVGFSSPLPQPPIRSPERHSRLPTAASSLEPFRPQNIVRPATTSFLEQNPRVISLLLPGGGTVFLPSSQKSLLRAFRHRTRGGAASRYLSRLASITIDAVG